MKKDNCVHCEKFCVVDELGYCVDCASEIYGYEK